MSENIESLKEAEKETMEDHHEPRSTQQTQRRREHKDGWVGGAVLILIGLVFLIMNTTNFRFDNWWALFIAIPALASFGNAWRQYQEDGRVSHRVRGSLMGGLFIGTVAVVFLFNISWGLIWPVFIILLGVGALLGR